MNQILAIIYDRLASEMLGVPMIFKNEVIALRQWDDICKTQNSAVRLHIQDYEFVQVGTLNTETLELTPNRRILITGAAWAAMQPAEEKA